MSVFGSGAPSDLEIRLAAVEVVLDELRASIAGVEEAAGSQVAAVSGERALGDTTLQALIAAEQNARVAGDQGLADQLAALATTVTLGDAINTDRLEGLVGALSQALGEGIAVMQWPELATIDADRFERGKAAKVYGPDPGTHIDPGSGTAVPNTGIYSARPGTGWVRLANLEVADIVEAVAEANAALDAKVAAAETALAGIRAIIARIESVGGWLVQYRDRFGRLLDGSLNKDTGLFAPRFAAQLVAGIRQLTFGVSTVRSGETSRFLTAWRDRFGRIMLGWDQLRGGVIIAKLLRADGSDAWAQLDQARADAQAAKDGANPRIAALRQLRYGEPMGLMAAPPRLSQTTAFATTIADGENIGFADRRIVHAHGVPVVGTGVPYNGSVSNGWVTTPAGPNTAGGVWSQRFMTDAPFFELEVIDGLGASHFAVTVDGQAVARSVNILMPNAGGSRYIRVDFGANAQGEVAAQTLGSGGSGHAVGDVLTVQGGTNNGRPMVVVVTGVDGSGAVLRWYVRDYGVYTALPGAGAATVSSGAGVGATFTLTNNNPRFSNHSTRRVRRFEIFSSNSKVKGLRVPLHSIVRPWPINGPRLFVMTDSYGDTFQLYAGGGYPWRIGQRLGIDDVWHNGRGGSGFLATNGGTVSTYRQRLGDLAARMPANPLTPAILLTQGSINDSGAADADLQAEVFAYWVQAFTTPAYAAMYFVQTGILRAALVNPADSKNNAVRAGFLAAQAIHDPNGRRSAFLETRGAGYELLTVGGRAGTLTGTGNTDFWNASDGAHPTQEGHDFLGDLLAADLIDIIARWS
ncbi:hypothetical protein ACPVPU_07365 [Sphingomonas sp. CJ99]